MLDSFLADWNAVANGLVALWYVSGQPTSVWLPAEQADARLFGKVRLAHWLLENFTLRYVTFQLQFDRSHISLHMQERPWFC